jgi:hypothetical protein
MFREGIDSEHQIFLGQILLRLIAINNACSVLFTLLLILVGQISQNIFYWKNPTYFEKNYIKTSPTLC